MMSDHICGKCNSSCSFWTEKDEDGNVIGHCDRCGY